MDHKLPLGMALLAKDRRGYVIPWFVDKAAPFKDGGPDFRIMDGNHLKLAIRERRCWVCGLRIVKEVGTFVAGPMCGINRTSAEPPCHLACAEASVMLCPFLSHPGRIRDESGLPAQITQAGVGIKRNPGVTMLWTAPYKLWRSNGILFELGEPTEPVKWFRMGRPATRAEVMESVETGLPLLAKQCLTQEDADALAAYCARFKKYMPEE
jgi:hypothetical protein